MKWKICDAAFLLAVLVVASVPGWAASWEQTSPKEVKAFKTGNLKEVKRIVEGRGEAFGSSYTLATALDFAASSGNVEVMKYLKSQGWFERCRKQIHPCYPLHAAADEGAGTNMLGFLISEGFQVDERGPLLMTPMFMAAKSGHLEAVRYLCEAGADPNAKNQAGRTAVQRANTQLGAVSLHPDRKEDARIRVGIKSVIQYLESGQCKKK